MTDRLKVGVAGGGLISQVEHIPNLLALNRQFDLRVVSDPSPTVRGGLSDRFGISTVANASELLGLGLDAIVIAAPDPWHAELATSAMDAGINVFCEKPLCYGVAEADALSKAEARNQVVLQIGYMKRFDPSYEAALELVAGKADQLRYISVEVHDPDAGPFVGHHTLFSAPDVPSDLIAATSQRRRWQVEAALGYTPSETVFRGFASSYCSALVHDVNAVHGLLDAMGASGGPVTGAALFAGGTGGQATVSLRGGLALWTMTHLEMPAVTDYAERIELYFDDEIVELVFPAPYLNHHPTRLTVSRSPDGRLEKTTIRNGFAEAFVRELEGFWSAIVNGTTVRNRIAHAARDQDLLVRMARQAERSIEPDRLI
ncbi:Gfo/Idh/MocA family protein [Microvirga antarctica]|uniref:Gfo/Idh/MocA family protein n=1 Tax=Microvirga antarctica TaxID=2819233 RepID=UPI001B316000|nr:Gfo/Idh/MocA family oxidoreductase [Microvirga antarctica]